MPLPPDSRVLKKSFEPVFLQYTEGRFQWIFELTDKSTLFFFREWPSSLLNTAKLMDENQTLYRLKELEYIEKICDRIDTISLSGRDGLLDSLNQFLATKK